MTVFRLRRTTEWTLEEVAPLEGVPLLKHAIRLIAAHGDGPLPRDGSPCPTNRPGPVQGEEVAFIAAETGDLVGALRGEPEEELLDWCGRLLVALTGGGPAKDMSDYPDGADAIGNYLRHIGTVAPTLDRLHHLHKLELYLTGFASDNPCMGAETRTRLAYEVTAMLDRPGWASLVEAGLASDDVVAVKDVLRLAVHYGSTPPEWHGPGSHARGEHHERCATEGSTLHQ